MSREKKNVLKTERIVRCMRLPKIELLRIRNHTTLNDHSIGTSPYRVIDRLAQIRTSIRHRYDFRPRASTHRIVGNRIDRLTDIPCRTIGHREL